MLPFPNIDPIIFSFGSLAISWYSLSYVIGILIGLYMTKRISLRKFTEVTEDHLDNFVTWLIIAIIIGGRLGYVLVYDPVKYLSNPIEILKTYEGGMSFHGGFIGLIIAAILFSKIYHIRLFALTDLCALAATIPIFLGRIANFINGELYGRVTDVPWSFIFPYSDGQMRHPSQLYESLTEGLLLFIILFNYGVRHKYLERPGLISGLFLLLYGTFRMIIEFFREPDIQIGFIFEAITMGQILCLPMIIFGTALIFYITKREKLK